MPILTELIKLWDNHANEIFSLKKTWPLSICLKMAAADAKFWASLETNFLPIECTLEVKTSVSNLTRFKLFIGDDKREAFWSDLLL